MRKTLKKQPNKKLGTQAEFLSNKQTEFDPNPLGQDGLVSYLHVPEKPNH